VPRWRPAATAAAATGACIEYQLGCGAKPPVLGCRLCIRVTGAGASCISPHMGARARRAHLAQGVQAVAELVDVILGSQRGCQGCDGLQKAPGKLDVVWRQLACGVQRGDDDGGDRSRAAVVCAASTSPSAASSAVRSPASDAAWRMAFSNSCCSGLSCGNRVKWPLFSL
jgi:hypothetical protein